MTRRFRIITSFALALVALLGVAGSAATDKWLVAIAFLFAFHLFVIVCLSECFHKDTA